MITRGILRGGLIGAALAAAFSLLGVIPVCGFAALPLRFLAWAVGGYVAGRVAMASGGRNSGVAAGLGAGLLIGIIDGVVNIALAPVRFKLAGDAIASLHALPEGVVKLFGGLGIDLLAMDTLGGSLFFAALMCGVLWLIAGVLGALAGGIAQALAE